MIMKTSIKIALINTLNLYLFIYYYYYYFFFFFGGGGGLKKKINQ